MRKLFILAAMILKIGFASGQTTSIYSFQINSIDGQRTIDFSAFKGKKILIVNTASQDTSFNQYVDLKQLCQLYKDSLVIVVFPSNSFNTETGSNNQITSAYSQSSTGNFFVAEKVNVNNTSIHPLYLWLTSALLNGRLNTQISRPCFKFLINKKGELVGVYGQRIRPLNGILRQAIELNN